jgi:hypothetical protein
MALPDAGSTAAPIEFCAVTKRYPGRSAAAVRELSLSVPAGEVCVLIGAVRKRQDDRDEDGQPPDLDHRGRHHDRRQEREQPRRHRAAQGHRLVIEALGV